MDKPGTPKPAAKPTAQPVKPTSTSSAKPASSSGASTNTKPATSSAKPAAPGAAPPAKPVVITESSSPQDKLLAVANRQITWAQAMGLTRTEAYGIAYAAHRLFGFGQVERARKMMEGLVVMNPGDSYFHALLGGICGRMGDEESALKEYTAAIKCDPNNLTARVNRADLYLRKGKLDVALEDLIAATKIDPKGKTPLGKRAQALARSTAAALHAILKKRGSDAKRSLR